MAFATEAAELSMSVVPIPRSFMCPITHEIMHDPVVTVDGQVYERCAIEAWLRLGHCTSPMTGDRLPSLSLMPETPCVAQLMSMWP